MCHVSLYSALLLIIRGLFSFAVWKRKWRFHQRRREEAREEENGITRSRKTLEGSLSSSNERVNNCVGQSRENEKKHQEITSDRLRAIISRHSRWPLVEFPCCVAERACFFYTLKSFIRGHSSDNGLISWRILRSSPLDASTSKR